MILIKEKRMKTMKIIWVAVFLSAAVLWLGSPALGQEPSCNLSPSTEKTFFFVRELYQDSNPLGELGSGWFNQGDKVAITTRTGQIAISYQLFSSDKRVKMDPTGCSGGTVISVP
jgi:hypothetical protein